MAKSEQLFIAQTFIEKSMFLAAELRHSYNNIENKSCVVDIETISKNEYSISPKLYVKQIGNEKETVDYEEGIKIWNSSSLLMHAEVEKLLNIL